MYRMFICHVAKFMTYTKDLSDEVYLRGVAIPYMLLYKIQLPLAGDKRLTPTMRKSAQRLVMVALGGGDSTSLSHNLTTNFLN